MRQSGSGRVWGVPVAGRTHRPAPRRRRRTMKSLRCRQTNSKPEFRRQTKNTAGRREVPGLGISGSAAVTGSSVARAGWRRGIAGRGGRRPGLVYAIQKHFHAVGTFSNCITVTGKKDLGKIDSGHYKPFQYFKKEIGQSHFFYSSVVAMADWSLLKGYSTVPTELWTD